MAPKVNLGSLAAADGSAASMTGAMQGAAGDGVELATNGTMVIASPTASGGISIGRVAAPADRASGTITIFLQIK